MPGRSAALGQCQGHGRLTGLRMRSPAWASLETLIAASRCIHAGYLRRACARAASTTSGRAKIRSITGAPGGRHSATTAATRRSRCARPSVTRRCKTVSRNRLRDLHSSPRRERHIARCRGSRKWARDRSPRGALGPLAPHAIPSTVRRRRTLQLARVSVRWRGAALDGDVPAVMAPARERARLVRFG